MPLLPLPPPCTQHAHIVALYGVALSGSRGILLME